MYILRLGIIFVVILRLIRNQEIYKSPFGSEDRVKCLTQLNSKAVYVPVDHTHFYGLVKRQNQLEIEEK